MTDLLKILLVGVLGFLCVESVAQKKAFKPKKIVFDKTTIYDSTGSNFMDSLRNSMESDLNSISDLDCSNRTLKSNLTEILDAFLEIETQRNEQRVIEIIKDTIWAYTIKQGKITGMERVDKVGQMNSYTENGQPEGKELLDISLHSNDRLEIFKKDVKEILGIRCYKVILELIQDGELGNTTYEMYVTNAIKLPVHALVWVDKVYRFFPLEMKRYMKNSRGISEKWQAISMEK